MTEAARLQELEDKEAIRQVFVDYARYLDNGDYAGYASLFAQSGEFGGAVGPEAIRERMDEYGKRVDAAQLEGRFHKAVHLMSNQNIVITGDTASADVIWSYVTINADQVPTIFQMGVYTDQLVREEGAWKIASHSINRLMGRAQLEDPSPSRLDAVSARQRELEDKEEIRQIFVDYARYLDSGDHAGYAGLYAREGVLAAQLGEAVGPAAIQALLDRARAPEIRAKSPDAIHVMHNVDIALDGDTAKAEVVWYYLTSDADGMPHILQGGRYYDDLVREDGAWKIARHDIKRMFGHSPLEAPLPTRLDALTRRLQELEDREEIKLLMIRAQDCLDQRDLKGYGECFTEDGVWSGVTGRGVGPQAIADILGTVCKPWESEAHRSYHIHVNSVIKVDGDTASSFGRWAHIFPDEDGNGWLRHVGNHDDKFRRTPDGWRFTQRAAFAEIPYVAPKFQLVGAEAEG